MSKKWISEDQCDGRLRVHIHAYFSFAYITFWIGHTKIDKKPKTWTWSRDNWNLCQADLLRQSQNTVKPGNMSTCSYSRHAPVSDNFLLLAVALKKCSNCRTPLYTTTPTDDALGPATVLENQGAVVDEFALSALTFGPLELTTAAPRRRRPEVEIELGIKRSARRVLSRVGVARPSIVVGGATEVFVRLHHFSHFLRLLLTISIANIVVRLLEIDFEFLVLHGGNYIIGKSHY